MERIAKLEQGALQLKPSRVIKAEDFGKAQDAQALVAHARAEAERIVAQAKEVFEHERARGLAEGREAAKIEMAEQMVETVGKIVEFLGTVEQDMIDIVNRALERILGEIGERELIVRIVKNILSTVRNEKRLTLRVAPDQVTVVKQRLNEILSLYPVIVEVQIVGDGRLSPTGCILESEIGLIDASLEGQLSALRKSFAKIFGERRKD
ncbi:MAG: HrpE/YscL family type III secretion apparatus protein [Alphaproteobacteria bacterium]|nr:HrpE/YscL family type III secretion apparatus protein [Alphaproteobacteria bacterium]